MREEWAVHIIVDRDGELVPSDAFTEGYRRVVDDGERLGFGAFAHGEDSSCRQAIWDINAGELERPVEEVFFADIVFDPFKSSIT